jgi:hypothetical protein
MIEYPSALSCFVDQSCFLVIRRHLVKGTGETKMKQKLGLQVQQRPSFVRNNVLYN